MSYSNDDYRGMSLGQLSDPTLYRLVDTQEDREFRHLETEAKPKRFARLRAKLKAVIAKTRRNKRRKHVPQPA